MFSKEAAKSLVTQFKGQGAEVRVLSVVEPVSVDISADAFPDFSRQVEGIEEERKRQASALVGQVTKDLRAAGYQATGPSTMGM